MHTDDLREALTAYVRTPPAELHGPVARLDGATMSDRENSDDWDDVLEQLERAARARRGRWAARSG